MSDATDYLRGRNLHTDGLLDEIAALRAEVERLTGLWKQADKWRLENGLEIERLKAEAREAHAIIDALGGQIKQLHDDDTRLRSLLRAVVREADRETNAFIAARAELGGD